MLSCTRSHGDSSVLEVADRDLPEPARGPGPGASGRRRREPDRLEGPGRRDRLTSCRSTRSSPARTAPGVVDEVGNGVYDVAAGTGSGCSSPSTTGPRHRRRVHRPPGEPRRPPPRLASYDVGASLGVPAMTAHRCLTVHEDGPTRLEPGALEGRVVLVTGGAGAVGHAAIQLARWAGATVVTTVSGDEKGRRARAAGAHHVVNYRESDAATEIRAVAPDGVDLVVDVAIIQNVDLVARVLKPRGAVSAYANTGGTEATLPVPRLHGAQRAAAVRAALHRRRGCPQGRRRRPHRCRWRTASWRSARSTVYRWSATRWRRPPPPTRPSRTVPSARSSSTSPTSTARLPSGRDDFGIVRRLCILLDRCPFSSDGRATPW